MRFAVAIRKVHLWISMVVVLPLLLVVVTGMLLLVRKDIAAIQPPTQTGVGSTPVIPFADVLSIAATAAPQAGIRGWPDIDRLDVRPAKGLIKVRANSHWEVQLDALTGDVLQVAYRRSDIVESLHDGTFFHENADYAVMLPSALILFCLLLTGIHMFIYPYLARRRRRLERAIKASGQCVQEG